MGGVWDADFRSAMEAVIGVGDASHRILSNSALGYQKIARRELRLDYPIVGAGIRARFLSHLSVAAEWELRCTPLLALRAPIVPRRLLISRFVHFVERFDVIEVGIDVV